MAAEKQGLEIGPARQPGVPFGGQVAVFELHVVELGAAGLLLGQLRGDGLRLAGVQRQAVIVGEADHIDRAQPPNNQQDDHHRRVEERILGPALGEGQQARRRSHHTCDRHQDDIPSFVADAHPGAAVQEQVEALGGQPDQG